jgi:tetratricopeptide (TPR) repeat protein
MRTLLYVLVGLSLTTAGVIAARELRAREDADALAAQARHVLLAPLARAPELEQIEAARAADLLQDAIAHHDAAETRALLHWAEALRDYQAGKLATARAALARAQRALPEQVELDVLAASIAARAGERARAAALLHRALAHDHPRARILAADLAADEGQPERALALLETVIARARQTGTLYNRRGLLHEALGARDLALADFERAAALDPRLTQPHLNLGRLLRERGRMREAEAAFGAALARDESAPEGWLGRGLTRIAQGDLPGGRIDVERARDLAPAEPAPLIALADLDALRDDHAQAVARYRAALVLAPADAVAWLKLGNTLTRTRDYAGAREAFERAIDLESDLGAAHNGLGAALMGAGDHAQAEKAFATAAALDARDPNPLRNLALLHARRGDARAAREARAQADARSSHVRVN